MTKYSPALMQERAREAVNHFRKQYTDMKDFEADVMIELGSGVGGLADCIDRQLTVPYTQIKHMPDTSVKDHKGQLIFGTWRGKNVICFGGRTHCYEGLSAHEVSFPVFVAYEFGANNKIFTSAGGVAPVFGPNGQGVRYPANVDDVLVLTALDPNKLPSSLRGEISEGMERFPGMMNVPSRYLLMLAREVAAREGLELNLALYDPRQGPGYETTFEISKISLISQALGLYVHSLNYGS